MVADATLAAVAALLVTASFPLYLKGAWIIIDAEVVTWGVLTHHLTYIVTGLALNTGVVLVWMVPRLPSQLGGAAALHSVLGLQAYAMLTFALTGIARILAIKRRENLYRDPDPDVALSDLHPEMDHWRKRLRIGVAGYVLFWILAWVVGMARFLVKYGYL